MAELIEIPVFEDSRGSLGVIEKILPFEIKRVYFIYNVKGKRGGHRHRKTMQALVCIGGSCEIFTDNGQSEVTYRLDSPRKCLILNPQDWHTMQEFTENAVLLVLASEYYSREDYIDERPAHTPDLEMGR